jgi:putative endopeptidase
MSTHRPQDDFYHFVNQQWINENPIPDTESRWGTFSVLRDQNIDRMQGIYESLSKKDELTDAENKIQAFYASGKNIDAHQDKNKAVLAQWLRKIDALRSPQDLVRMIGELHRIGVDAPWCVYVDSDEKDASRRILRLHQAQMTLSDRDYYLNDDESSQKVRDAYRTFFEQITDELKDVDPSIANIDFENILNFETELATHQRTNIELRDIEKNYNPISFQKLKSTYPKIDWDTYAEALHWQSREVISDDQPEVFAYVAEKIISLPLDTWKQYLAWLLIIRCASHISTRSANITFALFGTALTGAKTMKPAEKRTVLLMDRHIGEYVGTLYVEKYFPEEAKRQVETMVAEVTRTYHDRIDRLNWMSGATKQKAHEKLDNMKVLIGYPDAWRSYDGLQLDSESILANILAAEAFNNDYHLARLSEPNSRDEWHMSPQTVNAYHDPNRLVICFPAGILQAPFFDSGASEATNYGGIGTVIGHELTHGFDDQGSQFDAEGNVVQWQTDEEREEFMKRSRIISDQADNYEVLPGVHLKGQLVLGEAIADLGGLELAYEAAQRILGDDFNESAKDSFFRGYAVTEASSAHDEQVRQFALTDPHPHAAFRVNAMLEHVDAFHETYDVKEGDALYRPDDKRARIW